MESARSWIFWHRLTAVLVPMVKRAVGRTGNFLTGSEKALSLYPQKWRKVARECATFRFCLENVYICRVWVPTSPN